MDSTFLIRILKSCVFTKSSSMQMVAHLHYLVNKDKSMFKLAYQYLHIIWIYQTLEMECYIYWKYFVDESHTQSSFLISPQYLQRVMAKKPFAYLFDLNFYDGHSKHPLPMMQEKTLHMDFTRWSIPKSNWLYSL